MIIQRDDKTSNWFTRELSRILTTAQKIQSIKQLLILSDYDQTHTLGNTKLSDASLISQLTPKA